MMQMKKIAAGAVALLLAGTMTACGEDTSWAYRSGDDVVTSGMYVGLSIDALNAAYSLEGYDSSKSPFDQDLENMDSVQWLKQKAGALSREYLAVEAKFDEMGLSFTDEEQESLDTNVDFYWTTLGISESYEEAGCGKESFSKILTNSSKRNKIFEALYGEGGEKEVPESELKTIFETDYAKGTYITVSLLDEEGNALTGDALTEKKDEAQDLADRVEAGEDIEKVKAQYNDSEEEENADTSTVFLRDSESLTTVGSAIVNGEVGEVGVVTDDKYAYVYQVQDPLSGDTFDNYRSTVLQNLKSDEFSDLVTEWTSQISIEENTASLNKHSPKNLKKLLK